MIRARRRALSLAAASAMLLGGISAGRAQGSDAAAFVRQLGGQLVEIVNAPGTPASKTSQLQPVIDGGIAVDQIARFCLGSTPCC